MKAILTKYVGPSNTRGGRIIASDSDNNRVTISYPHELSSEQAHRKAAEALCKKMNWREVTMAFTLAVETDNAAFDGNKVDEVARILRETIRRLEDGLTESSLFDVNGNRVGKYSLE